MITPLNFRNAPTTAPPVPGQVLSVIATPISSTQINLSWTPPASGGTPTNYLVEYKVSSSGTWLTFAHAVSTATAASIIDLAQGTGYSFRLSAINSTGTGAVSATATASTAASSTIKLATYGDSLEDLGSVGNGPDIYDGANRSLMTLTSAPAGIMALPLYMQDVALVVNGGRSGETTSGWNSGARAGGVTNTAVKALAWDAIHIQYATNDVSNGVTSTATRDSVATAACANMQALIVDMLSTGRKVVWQTTKQRTAAGYGVNAVVRRDCVDYINYGDGGSIGGMTAWIQARSEYGTQLFINDIQALMNVGGASSGAYADGQWLDSGGTHPTYAGARRIAKSIATLLRTIYPDRGHLPMHRSFGPNLIPAASAAYYGSESLTNCTKAAITYGTDVNGRGYGETTITPNGTAGLYTFELLADVGTSGGRTPAGGTVAVNDMVQPRVLLTLDDGAGGAPSVNNVLNYMYCSYLSGPGLQQVTYSSVGQGVQSHAEADIEAQYITQPLQLTGDSSLIGAPSGGAGLRSHFQIYFPASAAPFRVRWTAPEIRKVA